MLPEKKPVVNLRTVADYVGLAPCSVSAILNNTPAAQVIPQTTKDRVLRAATELNYRPNLWARSLRTKRTRMVVAIAPDFGRSAVARVVAGAQSRLQQKGYLLALGTPDSSDAIPLTAQFQQRGIEGVIAIDTNVSRMELPVASVELSYSTSGETVTSESRAWLAALGESAAETIIQQIEQPGTDRRAIVGAKMPPAYYEMSHAARAGVGETA